MRDLLKDLDGYGGMKTEWFKGVVGKGSQYDVEGDIGVRKEFTPFPGKMRMLLNNVPCDTGLTG